MTEAQLHKAVADYLNLALPHGAIWHHSPNEGKRGWRAQAALKTHGTRKGWPDIEIIWAGRIYFLELKAPKKYATPEQRALHDDLRGQGCAVEICKSIEEVSSVLGRWLPIRARAA